VGAFFLDHVIQANSGLYLLFVLHFLDDRAATAMSDLRPVLTEDDAGYEKLRYQLTTMPARPVFVSSLMGLIWGLVATPPFLIPEDQARLGKLFTSPTASVFDYTLSAFDWMMVAVLVYHTIRQLRLISHIYTEHTDVNIFAVGPLYAFSRVTALTATAMLLLIYLLIAFGVNWRLDNPTVVTTAGAFMLVALVAFLWPLLGVHRLLQQEKTRWKGEVAQRLEAVARELHHRADQGDYSEMIVMNNAIDGLTKEEAALDKVSTWPWDSDTVRLVATALLLPAVLWVITRILERFGF
jgi:hypothetical protein